MPHDPVISLQGTYLKEHKTEHSGDTCTLMFIAALFIRAKLWKQSRCCTTDQCIMKLWYTYIMGYYSAKMNNDMGFEGKRMQMEDTMLSEASQDQKQRMHVFPHMGRIDTKINIYTKTHMIIYKLRCRTCL
jgi:hypothetical protein